jgi:probable addiction module antidote protein
MSIKTKPFDVAEHLETQEDIKMFLQDAAKGTPEEFVHALSTAARAMGMTEVAEKAGVTRSSLYKSLADGGKPQFTTISKVSEALGCKLAIV